MNKIYRKARKLILHPKNFFQDSQILNKKTKSNEQTINTEKTCQNPISIYINSEYFISELYKEHIKNIFSTTKINIKIGNYRFKYNEALFVNGNTIELVKINTPFIDGCFIKGYFLIEKNLPQDDYFSDQIHKVNVEHMKKINDFNMLYYYYKDRPEATDLSVTKYALNAGIYDSYNISRSLDIINTKYLTMHQSDLNTFFSKLYRVLGTDQKLENIANKLAQSIRKNIYPVAFIMKLSAFFCECGDFEKALEMARIAKSKDKNAWKKFRYLGLSHLLYDSQETNENWAKIESDLFKKLLENQYKFESYIKENKITIIGNSPVDVGSRKGSKIDNSGKIFRFNGAITDYPWSVDYGTKTDVLVINPRYYETKRNTKFNLDFIAISDGNLYSSLNLTHKIKDLEIFSENVFLFPRDIDISLTKKITASPSSGLKLLSYIYKLKGPIPRENLHGFSFVDQEHGVATSYSGGTRVGLNTIHDWNKEKEFFDTLIDFNKVTENA